MKILTHIGEAAVHYDGREFVFRPTLANIAEIGTPVEIVEAFGCLFSVPPRAIHPGDQQRVNRHHYWVMLSTAMSVLYACTDDDDVDVLIGSMHPPYRLRPGKMPAESVIAIARQMMRHGVVGVIADEKRAKGGGGKDFKAEFDAAEMAALAQAHLNMTTAEAWSMTMTSLIGALTVKFPPSEADKRGPMTVERNDAAVAWLEKVNKMRSAANG